MEAVTPGTADTALTTAALKLPVPLPLPLVTIRLAVTVLSMLLVADFLTDAPYTEMAETRARPDHQRRRGLGGAARAAHGVLPAQLAGRPQGRARGRPMALGERAGEGGGQHGHADEEPHRAEADELDGRLG